MKLGYTQGFNDPALLILLYSCYHGMLMLWESVQRVVTWEVTHKALTIMHECCCYAVVNLVGCCLYV